MKSPGARAPREIWWALRRSPTALPVVFQSASDARDDADPDEALYQVRIVNVRCVRRAQNARRRQE